MNAYWIFNAASDRSDRVAVDFFSSISNVVV